MGWLERIQGGAYPVRQRTSGHSPSGSLSGCLWRSDRAEYLLAAELRLRGGVHYETTPTRDGYRDTTVPDGDRLWLELGTTFRIAESWDVDLALNHIFFRDTSIHITRTYFDGTGVDTAVRINGSVNTAVNTLAFGIRHAF